MPDVPAEAVRRLTDRQPASGASDDLVITDPATGTEVGRYAPARQAGISSAVGAAAAAFPGWSGRPPAARAGALLELAAAVESAAAALLAAEVATTGKPHQQFLTSELPFVTDNLRFFAGCARQLAGFAAAEYAAGSTSYVRREPLGVVAGIVPWNYPLMMAGWKLGPALAAGNTVVLKPAEQTPLSALIVEELCAAVLGPGVVTVVPGDRLSGQLLVTEPRVAMISLTGSVAAGQWVAREAGARLARTHLELGGKAPALVFADADLEFAATRLARACFFNAGQDCTAPARILIQAPAREEFAERFAAAAATYRPGRPDDPQTTLGPLISAEHQQRVTGFLDRLPSSASVQVAGSGVPAEGYFLAPTIVTGVDQRDEIVQREVFGPVVTLQSFDDLAGAVQLANDTAYGLSASVWSRDVDTVTKATRTVAAGTVWVNTHGSLVSEAPHGGIKDSGYGSDLSAFSMEPYTQVKHVMTRSV